VPQITRPARSPTPAFQRTRSETTLIPVHSNIYVAGIDFVDDGDLNYDDDWPLHTIKLIE